MDFFSVLQLLLGLAFFLFGMNVMSANLEKMAGGKLEHLLKKMTANPFVSLLLGTGITMVIQSSSATTVMLVGLVNSGIMQLSQTIHVIFGANIGTTITAWILSLAGIESNDAWVMMLKPENFSPILAIVGIVMVMMCKSDRKKSVGTVLVGFAVLMYGMEIMSAAVEPLSEMPEFAALMVKFTNPIIGVIVGALVTALIQSSSASVGILQALALTGGVSYGVAIPIIMGQNIGTCVTALLSSIGATVKARRVAMLHLSIKVIGTIVFLSLYGVIYWLFGNLFLHEVISPAMIAVVHTVFNILNTVVLAPFSKLLLRLAEFLVKEKEQKTEDKEELFLLDDILLRSPSVAVQECNNHTVKMLEIAGRSVFNAMSLLENYEQSVAEKVFADEDRLDRLEDSMGSYLVKLSAQTLSMEDSQRVTKMLHAIGDFERLGDHAVNLYKVANEIEEKQIQFSVQAQHEIRVLTNAIQEIMQLTIGAYTKNDIALAVRVEPLEQVIDGLTAKIKNNHISRLQQGNCTIELGFILSDMLTNYERISDHCSNIAVTVIELQHNSFDTHKYLNEVKYGSSDFSETYKEFNMRYSL